MKKWIFSLGIVCCLSAQAHNDDYYLLSGKFAGSLTFVSDYLTDGLSSTKRRPAVQGDFYYELPNGEAIGLWESNVYTGGTTTIELYPYISWTGESCHFLWEVLYGYSLYLSTGEYRLNYGELRSRFGYHYQDLKVYIGLDYSHDYVSVAGRFFAPSVQVEMALAHGFTVFGLLARVMIERTDVYGAPNYYHWQLGVQRQLFDFFEVSLSYYDNDIAMDRCFTDASGRGSTLCAGGVLLSVAHEF